MLVHRDQRRVGLDPHLRRLHEADRILSTGRNHIHLVDDDLLGCCGDGHQAGRALPVDRHRRDADRAAGAKRDLATDIAELRSLGEHRAPNHVIDLARVDPGALDRRF
jgi:hypothetical protein